MSFDFIVALYALCHDYHSGQWSRGYRILSRIVYRYSPKNIPTSLSELKGSNSDYSEAIDIYYRLEAKYAHTL